MNTTKSLATAALVATLSFSAAAFAQQDHEAHHPGGATSNTSQPDQKMPMKEGMKPSEMPSGGMMGGGMMGKGMMGNGMMGKGMMQGGMMMGGGMMRQGMMGPMMQGGMMGRDCPMMGMAMGEGDGSTHSAGRIAFLKAELGITDKQTPAFEAYAEALKSNMEGMKAMREGMMSNMKSGTAGERLDMRIQAMEGRLATLKEVKPALDKLYGALSDEQKKKADEVLTGMGCMM